MFEPYTAGHACRGLADRDHVRRKRRVPAQERSRRRVERILDAAARLVVEHGVDALTTRDIAEAAEVPVASLYQYFADKDDILLALARARHRRDGRAGRRRPRPRSRCSRVATLVRTTMAAFVSVYHRRRAFVEIYLRGRTNAAVHRLRPRAQRAHRRRRCASFAHRRGARRPPT